MARASTNIVLFNVLLSAAANFMRASGISEDLGVAPDPGGDEAIKNATEASIDAGAGQGDTLLGVFTAIGQVFDSIFSVVFAGQQMLANLGVPMWVLALIFAPQAVIVAVDLAYAFSGRDM